MKKTLFTLCLCLVSLAVQAQDVATWKEEQKTDPLRGTSYTQFTLDGKFLSAPNKTSMTKPVLVVRCVPGSDHHGHTLGKYVSGHIATGSVIDVSTDDAGKAFIRVQFRLDDGKIQGESWSHSTDFSAIFLRTTEPFAGSGYAEFANLLYAHATYHKENTNPQVRKVVIAFPEFMGGEVVMQFDFPDSTAVAEACGIIWHK